MNQRISGVKAWETIIKGQVSSGQSVTQHCRQKSVCKTSFYDWRRRLGMLKSQKSIVNYCLSGYNFTKN